MTEHVRENRTWIPFDYIDEWSPAGRASPEAWLSRLDDGVPALGCADLAKHSGAHFAPRALAEGEIVEFVCSDDCGTSALTIRENGARSISPVPPLTATLWVPFDADSVSETVEGLVAYLRDTDGPGHYEIGAHIDSGAIPMRFAAEGETGRFTIVAREAVH